MTTTESDLAPTSPTPAIDARLDHDRILAVLAGHVFIEDEDGDGWNEPHSLWYRCSCSPREYAEWTQKDPQMTGLEELQSEGHDAALELHHTHLATILTGPAPVEKPKPEYRHALTEDAIEAGANQLRSQINDFTSPDILIRKRAKFVLRAALPYLEVEPA